MISPRQFSHGYFSRGHFSQRHFSQGHFSQGGFLLGQWCAAVDEVLLSEPQRDALREFMDAELIALRSEIANLEVMTRPISPDNAIGRLSRLEAMNEKSVNEVALRSARERVTRIEVALRRVDDEEFGLCAECAQMIPFARLKSMPGTRLCVDCTELAGG